jgi:hypothetical protein
VTKARARRLRRPTSPYVLNYFDVSFPISIFNDTPQSGEGHIKRKIRERKLGDKTMSIADRSSGRLTPELPI